MTLTTQLKQVVIEKLEHGENYRKISAETGASLGTISKLWRSRTERPSLIEQPISSQPTSEDTTINPLQLPKPDTLQEVKMEVQSKIDELVKTKQALEGVVSQLQTQVQEARRTLDIEKKAAEDFRIELTKYGINTLDCKRFVDTLHIFQKYDFDCNKMVEMFLEVKDVVSEKKHLEEAGKNENVVEAITSTLGINIEDLKKAIVSLMTLENFGIGVEQIVSLLTQQRYTKQNGVNYGYGRRY